MKNIFRIVPSSYLILVKNKKVLLLHRFNTGFQDGKYGLVAGHVEKNEGFTKALIREAEEEASVKLKPKDLKVVHVMNRLEDQNQGVLRERVDVFFLARKWSGGVKNMEPDKCDDLGWFSINKLPKNTIPYIKEVLRNVKKKKFYSEFGY